MFTRAASSSKMSSAQRDAWKALKLAVDKFSQTTGAEVAVATTCIFDITNNDNYLVYKQEKTKASVYGHGSLFHQVKKGLELVSQEDDSLSYGSQDGQRTGFKITRGFDNSNLGGKPIMSNKHHAASQDPVSRSLSTSFRTLKLDKQPHGTKPGLPDSIGNSSTAGSSPDPGLGSMPPRSSKRKGKHKKSNKQSQSDELELGDNLLFGEENHSSEDDDDNDSDVDESDESEEGFHPMHNRAYNVPPQQLQREAMNAAFATSLPVNINLAWGRGSLAEQAPRFHDNRGPHPPLYNPSSRVTHSKPTIIKAETATPRHETMMASMQALAKSVTDDSALIFGERPRPRTQAEQKAKQQQFGDQYTFK